MATHAIHGAYRVCGSLGPASPHCATVPRQRLPACRRPRYAAAPALGVNTRSRRSSIAAVHCRRPCVSRGRGASVEQSARFRHGVNVAANVQATPVNCTVREKLLNSGCFRRLEHLPSHVILFAYSLILFGVLAVVLILCHLNHIRLLTN